MSFDGKTCFGSFPNSLLSTPHTFTAPSLPPRKRGREEEELKENLTASFELSQKRQQVEVEREVLRETEVLKEVLIGEKEVQNEERKKVQRDERKRPAPPAPASQDKKLRRDDDNIFGFNDSPVKATPRLQAPARAEVEKVEEVEEMEEDMVGPSPQGAPLRPGWRNGGGGYFCVKSSEETAGSRLQGPAQARGIQGPGPGHLPSTQAGFLLLQLLQGLSLLHRDQGAGEGRGVPVVVTLAEGGAEEGALQRQLLLHHQHDGLGRVVHLEQGLFGPSHHFLAMVEQGEEAARVEEGLSLAACRTSSCRRTW